jgi:hypothetical protein
MCPELAYDVLHSSNNMHLLSLKQVITKVLELVYDIKPELHKNYQAAMK